MLFDIGWRKFLNWALRIDFLCCIKYLAWGTNICKVYNQTKLKDRKQFIIICVFEKTHKRCLKYLVSMIIKVLCFNNTEIGMLLIALAALFQTLGVLMFFKRSLILISNVAIKIINFRFYF